MNDDSHDLSLDKFSSRRAICPGAATWICYNVRMDVCLIKIYGSALAVTRMAPAREKRQ